MPPRSGTDKNKKIAKHIEDIEPISERLMYITIDGTIPINFIIKYMPTAIDPTETKHMKTYKIHVTSSETKDKPT